MFSRPILCAYALLTLHGPCAAQPVDQVSTPTPRKLTAGLCIAITICIIFFTILIFYLGMRRERAGSWYCWRNPHRPPSTTAKGKGRELPPPPTCQIISHSAPIPVKPPPVPERVRPVALPIPHPGVYKPPEEERIPRRHPALRGVHSASALRSSHSASALRGLHGTTTATRSMSNLQTRYATATAGPAELSVSTPTRVRQELHAESVVVREVGGRKSGGIEEQESESGRERKKIRRRSGRQLKASKSVISGRSLMEIEIGNGDGLMGVEFGIGDRLMGSEDGNGGGLIAVEVGEGSGLMTVDAGGGDGFVAVDAGSGDELMAVNVGSGNGLIEVEAGSGDSGRQGECSVHELDTEPVVPPAVPETTLTLAKGRDSGDGRREASMDWGGLEWVRRVYLDKNNAFRNSWKADGMGSGVEGRRSDGS